MKEDSLNRHVGEYSMLGTFSFTQHECLMRHCDFSERINVENFQLNIMNESHYWVKRLPRATVYIPLHLRHERGRALLASCSTSINASLWKPMCPVAVRALLNASGTFKGVSHEVLWSGNKGTKWWWWGNFSCGHIMFNQHMLIDRNSSNVKQNTFYWIVAYFT